MAIKQSFTSDRESEKAEIKDVDEGRMKDIGGVVLVRNP